MVLMIVLWAAVVLLGFLWGKRRSSNKKSRTRP